MRQNRIKMFFFLLFIINGCSNLKEKLFLDFYAGMSMREFEETENELISAGKLLKDESTVSYQFEFPDSKESLWMPLDRRFSENEKKLELTEITLYFPMDPDWGMQSDKKHEEMINSLRKDNIPIPDMMRVRFIEPHAKKENIQKVYKIFVAKYGNPYSTGNQHSWKVNKKHIILVEGKTTDGRFYSDAKIIFKISDKIIESMEKENSDNKNKEIIQKK